MAKDYSNIDGLIGNVKESIRNAYDKGYKQGVNDGSLDVKMRVDGAYEKGLNDAWECARKIVLPTIYGGIPKKELKNMFTCGENELKIFNDFSISKVINKINEYEEKQKADDEIKVGDEVYLVYPEYKRVIFRLRGVTALSMDEKGETWADDINTLHKTGRHFPQIAEVLKQLKEAQDEDNTSTR